jgi:hypothetical protein
MQTDDLFALGNKMVHNTSIWAEIFRSNALLIIGCVNMEREEKITCACIEIVNETHIRKELGLARKHRSHCMHGMGEKVPMVLNLLVCACVRTMPGKRVKIQMQRVWTTN